MKSQSFEKEFEEYLSVVYDEISDEFKEEIRRAFYGGAIVLSRAYRDITDTLENKKRDEFIIAIRRMKKVQRELHNFVEEQYEEHAVNTVKKIIDDLIKES